MKEKGRETYRKDLERMKRKVGNQHKYINVAVFNDDDTQGTIIDSFLFMLST